MFCSGSTEAAAFAAARGRKTNDRARITERLAVNKTLGPRMGPCDQPVYIPQYPFTEDLVPNKIARPCTSDLRTDWAYIRFDVGNVLGTWPPGG